MSEKIMVTQENMFYGARVVRGRDWCWSNQDFGDESSPCEGTIVKAENDASTPGWIHVKWDWEDDIEDYDDDYDDDEPEFSYRIGYNNHYDLYLANPTIDQLFWIIENRIAQLEKQLAEKLK
jgi:hypothetical protein